MPIKLLLLLITVPWLDDCTEGRVANFLLLIFGQIVE